VATRGADRTVKVWDLSAAADRPVWSESCDDIRKFGTANSIAFSPDGRLLATGSGDVVKVWNWKNRQLLHELPGHTFHSVPVAFSSDGRLATAAFRDGLKLWDPQTGTLLRTIEGHREPVSALAFSADGRWLASACLRSPVKLSDSTGDEPPRTFDELHSGNVECVAVSRDGRRLASGGEDKTVRVWDAATGREVLGLRGHTERCACVAYSPDGLRLASASADTTIRIWDGSPLREDEHGEEMLTFAGHSDEIRSVAVSPDGRQVASSGDEGVVMVWDPRTGRPSAGFRTHMDPGDQRVVVFSVTWHPKRDLIAATSLQGVRVWDPRTSEDGYRIPAGPGKVGLPYASVAFSPDGRYLVTGKHDGAVRVWDGQTGEPVGTLDTHQREIRGVAFSGDGAHLASASSDGEIKLWDAKRLGELRSGAKLKPRIPPIRARVAGPGLSMAFSPDGQWLVTGGEENTVRVWDVKTGRELRPPLRGHTGDIYALAVSPDGRWVASGSEDSTVKVWDGRNGFRLVHSFRGHTGVVASLAFAAGPDGLRLVSGSRDHTAKVWDVSILGDEPDGK
jgi:WD40 repeat protein